MKPDLLGFTQMFEQSIGIAEPWYISGAEFVEDKKEVHIYVDVRDSAKLKCPECGQEGYRYGYEKSERVWRHGDCLFYPTYVHCRRPRIKCMEHGARVVTAPWARPTSRFTLLFEGYTMLLLADMPVRKTSQLLKCNEKSLARIMRYWVQKAVDEDNLSNTRYLSIDETSFKKKQTYVTVIIDGDARRVIDVEQGRGHEAIEEFSYKLEKKGGDCSKIKYVTSDMSKAYRMGIELCFPQAEQVIDRFHVKKLMLDAVDEVRRAEQKGHRPKGKRLLMIPEKKLTNEQKDAVQSLSKMYPKTGRAYRMVTALDEIYFCTDYKRATELFNKLYRWMRRSRLDPMKKTAQTLREYKEKILAFIKQRITSAISEGINSMIQAAKRKARGYNTIEGYMCMIYLIAAKLKLSCPNPLFL